MPHGPALFIHFSASFRSFQIVYNENAILPEPEMDSEGRFYNLKPDSVLASPPKKLLHPLC